MHELAITEQILATAVRYAVESQAARITDLYLVVGELSSIVDDSVQFYWDFVAAGTLAEGATLHFRRIPAEMCCTVCHHTYSPYEALPCPACSSTQTRITAGEAFALEAIDVVYAEDALIRPAAGAGSGDRL